MDSLRDKFRRFMVGRYGMDELNRFLSSLILVFVVLHLFFKSPLFFWLELACLVLIYGRMFSKNTGKRFYENQTYLQMCFHGAERARKLTRQLKEARKFKIFKCPNCGQRLRIPRGHGRIQVHCRGCGHDFMGRS
ncbi:MAG: hypothetical protein HFG76_14525 [Hungatella sp.]|nr:hypothetical protein [Hungatella sp.]